MQQTRPSLCDSCVHRSFGEALQPVCAAFPNGIPLEFAIGLREHRDPNDGTPVYEYNPLKASAKKDYDVQASKSL